MFVLGGRKAVRVPVRAFEYDEAEGTEGGDAGGYNDDIHFDPVGVCQLAVFKFRYAIKAEEMSCINPSGFALQEFASDVVAVGS